MQSLLTTSSLPTLLSLPFPPSLLPEVDSILLSLTRKHLASTHATVTNPSAPPYERILYAWRIQQQNHRGAAEVLYEQLERLKTSNEAAFEPEDETLLDAYLVLINTLACCGKEESWLLAEDGGVVSHSASNDMGRATMPGAKDKGRKIVTLEDVRREYQGELDRRSEILQGRFPLGGGDEMVL